jgi:hypothetical protein
MLYDTGYLTNFEWINVFPKIPAIEAKRLIDAMPIKDLLVTMGIKLTDIENIDSLKVKSWIESGFLYFAFDKEVS